MTKKEQVKKNISLTFDFIRDVIRNPSKINSIPDGNELVFVDSENVLIPRPKSKKVTYIKVRKSFQPINNA